MNITIDCTCNGNDRFCPYCGGVGDFEVPEEEWDEETQTWTGWE